MEKEEIFRIFDACQPTIAQVREYLEKISKESPLELVFRKNGKDSITKKIDRNMGELVGIVVGTTIFYTKVMTWNDVKFMNSEVTAKDVFAFGQKIHPKAIPLNDTVIEILREKRRVFLQIAEMLELSGFPKTYTQKKYLLFNQKDKDTRSIYCNTESNHNALISISYFLKNYGDIYFFASI